MIEIARDHPRAVAAVGYDSPMSETDTPADAHADTKSLAELPMATLAEALAAKSPAPGGGAAACAACAVAAGLAGMVVAYSLGKKRFAEQQASLESAREHLARAATLLMKLGDEDAAAYEHLNALQKLPEGDARRRAEEPAAVLACIDIPRASLAACIDVLRVCESLAGASNEHLRSDLAGAAAIADGAARAAAWNVRINLPMHPDADRRSVLLHEMEGLVVDAQTIAERVDAACREGWGSA